jgi:hypothetical protein
MASPTRSLFTPGKQARVSLSFSERIAERINARCLELGCEPKDYVRYAVMRDLDRDRDTPPSARAGPGLLGPRLEREEYQRLILEEGAPLPDEDLEATGYKAPGE